MVSQVLLLSQPRTACHLLERILSSQPNVQYLWHPIVAARPWQTLLLADEQASANAAQDPRAKFEGEVRDGVARWEEALSSSHENGEVLFVHEHPHFALSPDLALEYAKTPLDSDGKEVIARENYTLIPDALLLHPGTIPIFTIRHPCLTIPAAFKAMSAVEHTSNRANLLVASRTGWQRDLYDWYIDKGFSPLVIDTDDFIANPDLIRELCTLSGLDPTYLKFDWPKTTAEEKAGMMPMYVALQGTLLDSTGIVAGKARREIVVEEEAANWIEIHGVQQAALLRELLELSLPHYHYLTERKITLSK